MIRRKKRDHKEEFFDEALRKENEEEVAFKEMLHREYGFWAIVKAFGNNIIRSLKRKGSGA